MSDTLTCPPLAAGHWGKFARLSVGGHVATVERSGALFVVALNGSTLSAWPTWRKAMAHAAGWLANRPGA